MRKLILYVIILFIPVIIFFIYQQITWNNSYGEYKINTQYENGNLKTEEIITHKVNDIKNEYIYTKKYYDNKEILISTTIKKEVSKMKFRDGWFHTIYRVPKFDSITYYSNGNKSKEFFHTGFWYSDILTPPKSALTKFNSYFENGKIHKSVELHDGSTYYNSFLPFSQTKEYHTNGELFYSKNYITESDKKENWVRHRFKNTGKFEIDKNIKDWSNFRGDTILYPYKFKSFNEFGQIVSIGIFKPLTVEDDSDVFQVDGKLSILEIFNYKENIGVRLPNGRINGSTEIIHPKLNPNLKSDLRIGTKEEKTYWSSPEISFKVSNRLDEEYMLFTGVIFISMYEYMSSLTNDRKILEKFDNSLKYIHVYKDGLKLFELDLQDFLKGVNSEDAKEIFTSHSFETNLKEYLTIKGEEYYYDYYIEDSNLFENNFEFRLGNFKDETSPIVYDFNDLINSPQGKLIKIKK